jgi:hypothetical protein
MLVIGSQTAILRQLHVVDLPTDLGALATLL